MFAVNKKERKKGMVIGQQYFVYYFGGLECVSHSFAYVAHL
jgi:hypothetical protein